MEEKFKTEPATYANKTKKYKITNVWPLILLSAVLAQYAKVQHQFCKVNVWLMEEKFKTACVTFVKREK